MTAFSITPTIGLISIGAPWFNVTTAKHYLDETRALLQPLGTVAGPEEVIVWEHDLPPAVAALAEARPDVLILQIGTFPNGERAILYDPGEKTAPEVTEPLLAAIRGADALLLDRNRPGSLAGARAARAAGVTVQLDAGGFDERVMEIIPLCDIAIASAYYAGARGLAPEAAVDELLALGVRIAIVTLGARGAIGKTAGEGFIRVPAFQVQVVDTTGAGDVYHGAFIVAYLEGQSLSEAMRFAAVAAALKCRQPGGRAGIPGRVEIDAALAGWAW